MFNVEVRVYYIACIEQIYGHIHIITVLILHLS